MDTHNHTALCTLFTGGMEHGGLVRGARAVSRDIIPFGEVLADATLHALELCSFALIQPAATSRLLNRHLIQQTRIRYTHMSL